MVGLFNNPKRKMRKLVDDGDYEGALELGHSLENEKKYQHDEQLLFIIGSVYYILGDADNSLKYLDKSLEINSYDTCLLYTSPSPRDGLLSRMPSSA